MQKKEKICGFAYLLFFARYAELSRGRGDWRDALRKRAGGTFLAKAAKQFVIASW